MKKFHFKLQKLLDMREARENEVKNELMKVLGEQNKERALQDELKQKINLYEGRYRDNLKKGKFSSDETMMLLKYVDASRRAISDAEIRIQDMEPEINRIRLKLVEASREKKVVEKLREKKIDEFNYELAREIAKENDDMNQKIYMRKLMEG